MFRVRSIAAILSATLLSRVPIVLFACSQVAFPRNRLPGMPCTRRCHSRSKAGLALCRVGVPLSARTYETAGVCPTSGKLLPRGVHTRVGAEGSAMFRLLDLPADVFDKILDVCGIDAAVQFGQITPRLRKHVNGYLCRRYHRILSFHLDDVVGFRDAMRRTSAVLSGSSALQFIHFAQHWWDSSLSGLDVYVGDARSEELTAYLENCEGYTRCSPHPKANALVEHARSFAGAMACTVSRVVKLTRDSRLIHVIVASSGVSIHPIFTFHSTVVMNWLSADAIFCAYPWFTFQHLNIVNPVKLVGPGRDRLRGVDFNCVAKYLDRGYSLGDVSRHKCRSSLSCPHTIRSTIDSGIFHYSFDKRTPNGYDVGQSMRSGVMWRWGGRACAHESGSHSTAPILLTFPKLIRRFHA